MALAVYIGLNLGLILYQPWTAFARDWALWSSVVIGESPYGEAVGGLRYVWSPLMVPVMAAAVALPAAWAAAHVVAVLLTRDRLFILLMLTSWGFWTDLAGGNTFTFVVVSGLLAWRGSRPAALVYLALLMVMPRPIQVPLALLLLARMPEIRLPAALLFAGHGIVVAPYAADWIGQMVTYARATSSDLGPRVFIGGVWLPMAFALAAALTLVRRPGWAGLFASVYWLPQYFLMPLIDIGGGAALARPAHVTPRNESLHS